MSKRLQKMAFALAAALAVGLALPGAARAAESFVFWPNAKYDPAIPTLRSVVGHDPGQRVTWHAETLRYFEALAAKAPDRIQIRRYAQSWEDRDLFYAVIASPENLRRIADVQAGMQRLADPRRTPRAEADSLIATLPAVTWLSYGVHGNEISSTDAAILTAYHLLAAQNDPLVADVLKNSVVILDPMQNPDGRDRFIHAFEMAEGLLPDQDRLSAEHDEPWPNGRTNHYGFDLNRDWFILTQPETRGRIKAMLEWFPVAMVDAHEMGSDSTYFFGPEAIPYNPHLAKDQRDNLALFGRNNARWFDRFGLDYYTREVFDAFYPGYGASWPSYFGSVAMTYEQASSRGLVVRQYDGNVMYYRETVRNHFVTSLSTAQTVATNREKFLRDLYNYRVTAIEEGGRGDHQSYILPLQSDQAGADKLAGLLVSQGVEVGRATESFRACGQQYAAGSYVINAAQPAKRLIRTLLDRDVPMEEAFIKEQERRRAKKLPDEIYDVTGWSLPLMMNLKADLCSSRVNAATKPAGPELVQPGTLSGTQQRVAYLVPWGSGSAVRLLARSLRAGFNVKSSDAAFTLAGKTYPAGTLIFDAADNPATLPDRLTRLARETGASVVAVDDSWVTQGPSFGSDKVMRINKPRVALAWDVPAQIGSAGAARFVIERQYDYPVTALRTPVLASQDLSRYQVIILPGGTGQWGGYAGVLGERGADNLKKWVERGGVLIGLGNATRWLADPSVDLLSIRRENAAVASSDEEGGKGGGGKGGGGGGGKSNGGDGDEEEEPTVEGENLASPDDYAKAIAPEKVAPDAVAGVLVRAETDPDHWLGAGVASQLHVLVTGPDIYTPLRLDQGVNVARFTSPENLLASGYLWEQNRKQLAFKPFTVIQERGNGFVIGFTQDPNTRAYLDGLNVLFMNAIFRGASHARPLR
jgi:hypothetical protein